MIHCHYGAANHILFVVRAKSLSSKCVIMPKPAQYNLFKKVERKEAQSKSRGVMIAYSEGFPLDGELVRPGSWPISYHIGHKAHIVNCPARKGINHSAR